MGLCLQYRRPEPAVNGGTDRYRATQGTEYSRETSSKMCLRNMVFRAVSTSLINIGMSSRVVPAEAPSEETWLCVLPDFHENSLHGLFVFY
jgi:hypothetical protein